MRSTVSASQDHEVVRPREREAVKTISPAAHYEATKGTGGLALDNQDKKAGNSDTPRRKPRSGKPPQQGTLGNALRSVYQQTVNEEIPPDLLDLLGKLR